VIREIGRSRRKAEEQASATAGDAGSKSGFGPVAHAYARIREWISPVAMSAASEGHALGTVSRDRAQPAKSRGTGFSDCRSRGFEA